MAQEKEVNWNDPQTWLLGNFEADVLLEEPHSLWYNKVFDEYDIDNDPFISLAELNLSDVEVLIVLATWCPDSRREVPRFMKISQMLGMDQEKIRMVGTDSYKKAPIDNYDDLEIDRVPTFIFYRNKKEIGRIIEYPMASLEKDMLGIFGDKK